MNEIVDVLDGWYCLHDFRTVDWTSWKLASDEEKKLALEEFQSLLTQWNLTQAESNGSHIIYTIVGQKADLMLMIVRPTMEELGEIETALNKTRFAEYLMPAYSYVSVVELTNYLEKGVNPYQNPRIRSRLYPTLPKMKHACFYPMDKRRSGNDNWYMLPIDERREFMSSHGRIGRKYGEVIRQIITGSMGFDDWEWGVTLFSDDVLQFKKIVYEMRFDEVSARFGEFGSFFVGNLLLEEQINHYMNG